jgi:hypothetical protein
MTYASRLLKTMELTDFPAKKKLNPAMIDSIIEKAERAANRRRIVCKSCFTQTSTDKSCFCE